MENMQYSAYVGKKLEYFHASRIMEFSRKREGVIIVKHFFLSFFGCVVWFEFFIMITMITFGIN